mmetsp:Transcript_39854/g.114609  ORF Transcript_39854/g.114609 Transcript_39854/m.114609 type:complete len:282 (-) Transcript_39854:525-1370(-)
MPNDILAAVEGLADFSHGGADRHSISDTDVVIAEMRGQRGPVCCLLRRVGNVEPICLRFEEGAIHALLRMRQDMIGFVPPLLEGRQGCGEQPAALRVPSWKRRPGDIVFHERCAPGLRGCCPGGTVRAAMQLLLEVAEVASVPVREPMLALVDTPRRSALLRSSNVRQDLMVALQHDGLGVRRVATGGCFDCGEVRIAVGAARDGHGQQREAEEPSEGRRTPRDGALVEEPWSSTPVQGESDENDEHDREKRHRQHLQGQTGTDPEHVGRIAQQRDGAQDG